MELRRFPRFSVNIPVAFWSSQDQGEGQIVNLSLGGCAVECEPTPIPGTYLKLYLTLPSTWASLVIDLAPVRWAGTRQFGVEFIRMDDEAQSSLHQCLETLSSGTA